MSAVTCLVTERVVSPVADSLDKGGWMALGLACALAGAFANGEFMLTYVQSRSSAESLLAVLHSRCMSGQAAGDLDCAKEAR